MDALDVYKTLKKLFLRLCRENNIDSTDCKAFDIVIPIIVGDLMMLQSQRGYHLDKVDVENYGRAQFYELINGTWKPAYDD